MVLGIECLVKSIILELFGIVVFCFFFRELGVSLDLFLLSFGFFICKVGDKNMFKVCVFLVRGK